MSEDRIIEPFAVPEIFIDGFTKHVARDGVMTCVGYRNMKEGKVVVVRLVWPVVNTNAAIDDAMTALEAPLSGVVDAALKRDVH